MAGSHRRHETVAAAGARGGRGLRVDDSPRVGHFRAIGRRGTQAWASARPAAPRVPRLRRQSAQLFYTGSTLLSAEQLGEGFAWEVLTEALDAFCEGIGDLSTVPPEEEICPITFDQGEAAPSRSGSRDRLWTVDIRYSGCCGRTRSRSCSPRCVGEALPVVQRFCALANPREVLLPGGGGVEPVVQRAGDFADAVA